MTATLLTVAALFGGCGNDNDEQLFEGDRSPTQVQKDEMGRGPETIVDPADGVSEDPFTNDPNYPYSDTP